MNSNSKVNIEYEPKRVYLLIGLFAGVILMLVVESISVWVPNGSRTPAYNAVLLHFLYLLS